MPADQLGELVSLASKISAFADDLKTRQRALCEERVVVAHFIGLLHPARGSQDAPVESLALLNAVRNDNQLIYALGTALGRAPGSVAGALARHGAHQRP